MPELPFCASHILITASNAAHTTRVHVFCQEDAFYDDLVEVQKTQDGGLVRVGVASLCKVRFVRGGGVGVGERERAGTGSFNLAP